MSIETYLKPMNTAPRDGTWVNAVRESGTRLEVSWRVPLPGSLFLGTESRWLTLDSKAGEVPFDLLVSWDYI